MEICPVLRGRCALTSAQYLRLAPYLRLLVRPQLVARKVRTAKTSSSSTLITRHENATIDSKSASVVQN
jgi:hypothetical protein